MGGTKVTTSTDMGKVSKVDRDGGALPNLLVIGAPKCGTTSLHNYLDVHPEISMSEVKELNFFSGGDAWYKGTGWYETNFDPAAKVRGESSTAYTRGHNAAVAADRAKSVLGDVRLVYLVRNPVDRIQSDYHHHRAIGEESRSLSVALEDPENPYVLATMYGSQIRPYVDHFGKESILVETQEQLLRERRVALQRIFRFLEVSDRIEREEFDRTWERSEGKGWAYSLGWKMRQRGIRLPRALRWPAQRLQRSRLLGGASGSARPPEINDDLRASLVAQIHPEVEMLRELTGMSFDDWDV